MDVLPPAPDLLVEVWSDIACPWCWIGKRRFEQALARFPHRERVEVRWRAFELDPSRTTSEPSGSYVERLAAKYGRGTADAQAMVDTMTRTAAAVGLDMRFDRARPSGTFDAHRLLKRAEDDGVGEAAAERLMRAYLTEGEPVAERDALLRLAVEAGLDAGGAAAVLDGDAHADEVRADEAEAAALGITGVPFFVLGRRYGVSGAQPAEVLLDALTRAWDERPVLSVVGAPADGCSDGSCAV